MTEAQTICQEFSIAPWQADNLIELLDEGNTLPFIARYRKERHGELDDQKLRQIAERLEYVRALNKRRDDIRASLSSQGVLDEALSAKLGAAKTQAELEDIYRPYKPKRKTRASVAREKGLEPLAAILLLQNKISGTLEDLIWPYVDEEKGVNTPEEALAGAKDILAEQFSDDADIRKRLRAVFLERGKLASRGGPDDSIYRLYYDYAEPLRSVAGHRILAVNRGEAEGYLKVRVELDERDALDILYAAFVRPGSITSGAVREAAEDAYARLIFPSMEREARSGLTERAQDSSIRVFAENLRNLLMQPPVKGKTVLALDPGIRTGCKAAVVDGASRVLETAVIYPLPEQGKVAAAKARVLEMIKKYNITAIAVGNGTAGRETERFVAETLKSAPNVGYTIVNEAGASVYSASKIAAEEFPSMDVSLRSAVSLARRLQDPLAELVKIDPKAIGVGQYQHDMKEAQLDAALGGVVEDCVNAVGVDVNTASAPLLSYVAGIGPALARNIVAYREKSGPFGSRAELKLVNKLGNKAFEQCAGFLRVPESKNPLDRSAVHPESYGVTEALLRKLGYKSPRDIDDIREKAAAYPEDKLAGELGIGLPTLKDILSELLKPGRDPRGDLPPVVLRTDIVSMDDLTPGMEVKGTVRNVVDFGAFVDIGVHRDGLIHISRLAKRRISHPSEVLKVGENITCYVVEVNKARNQIGLSLLPLS